MKIKVQGPVPERSISANPGLKFCSSFVIYLPTYLGVKAQQYFFSSSCMSLDKKTLLKTWLNPGLNLTIFWGTGPWSSWQYYHHDRIFDYHWLSPWWTQISELVVSVTVGVCVLQKNNVTYKIYYLLKVLSFFGSILMCLWFSHTAQCLVLWQ